MADEQVRLDELPQRQYEAAREDGATETVAKSEVEEVPKVTGEERQMKTYNEKRDAQESRGKGGFQKRIDGLIREREQERERREAVERRLQEIEGRNGNSNGEDLQRQESESHS